MHLAARAQRSRTPTTTNLKAVVHLYALKRRTPGRLLVATLIALIALSVATHHSGFASMGHEGQHKGGEQGALVNMCAGMAVAGVAVEGLLLIRRSRRNAGRRRRPPARRLLPASVPLPPVPSARARAGPPLHLQLCVIRR